MVVVHHTAVLSQIPILAFATHISAPFAVQAFFVVSGFLVTMSFDNSRSVYSYALKRLRRIAPAYVFVVGGTAVALCVISNLSWREYFGSVAFWKYLFFNLALANFAAPSLPGVFQSNPVLAVNGSLWTIKIEIAFYLLVPAMIYAVRRFGNRRVFAVLFAGSLLWKLGFDAIGISLHQKLYVDLAKQIPGQLSFFVGGAYAYYQTRQGDSLPRIFSLPVVLVCILGYATCDGLLADIIEPLAVTLIVCWAAIGDLNLPPLGRYGDFSYGTYLYHFPLIQTAIATGLFAISPLAAECTVIVAVAACATFSWFVVEKPWVYRKFASPKQA